jgi:squalene-associated FAD-dependent desaturase
MGATIHVIGAGLAGLSAALGIDRGRYRVVVHEAARHAGGRCRSYHDAALGRTIDNGNHLLLSGNRAVADYCREIGSLDLLQGPREAAFPFADLATGARWVLRPNAGSVPWWIFVRGRRVPETGWRDYLSLGRLLGAGSQARIGEVMACEGRLYDLLWHPFLVAALNTEPRAASAALAGAVVRETLAKGGRACRPLVATGGLGEAFIDPALALLRQRGADIRFDHRLRRLDFDGMRVAALDFGEDRIALAPGDGVILTVPAPLATLLVPGLTAPTQFRSILNAHFLVEAPPGLPALTGLVNSTAEWLFRFEGRLSVTISAADRFLETPREDLASRIWQEVASVAGLPKDPVPPWRIIKEKRATFAALPEEDAKRPGAETAWRNLILAGDWTQTGLPATIEGALRSGRRAAKLAAA